MSLFRGMILITADDVVPRDAKVAESDCACPNGGFAATTAAFQDGDQSPYGLPGLHTDQLPNGFLLAFNPLGQAGVVAFNRPVWNLLNAFRQPRALDDGVRLAGNPPDGLRTARRLARLGLLEPVDRQRQPRPLQPQTLTAWLHVTNDCNLRCPYCYVRKTPDEMDVERGRQAVDAVFRSAGVHGYRRVKLKYAGGEPTLNLPVVLALHEHAHHLAERYKLQLDGVVLSNGVALSGGMIEALKARNIRLMISLDGVGEDHDKLRPFANGTGSFRHVERTLDRLAAHGFTPAISITISRRNLNGLPAVVAYVLQRELPFTLNFYRENDCSATFADLICDDEQIIAAMKAAFAVIEANLPPYSLLDRLVDRARLDTAHDHACGVGHSYLVIDQRGRVARCHMELERPLTDVSIADPLLVIREDQDGIQNLPVEEKEGCCACAWRYWCSGGCPILTCRVTGRFDVKSPNCRIYRALFPEVLRLEGLRLLKYGLPQVGALVT